MNRQEFKELLSKRVLILDGATGTELQKYNFLEGVSTPEELNIKFPERIEKIYFHISTAVPILFLQTLSVQTS